MVTVRVGYVYDWFYIYPGSFGDYGNGGGTAFLRGENFYWQEQKVVIGSFDARKEATQSLTKCGSLGTGTGLIAEQTYRTKGREGSSPTS